MDAADLLAPCGMDCAHCSAYLSRGTRRQEHKCTGCLPRRKQCAYIWRDCETRALPEGRVRFCFECEAFPCERLRKIDKRYAQRGWPNSFIRNNERIREIGPEAFAREQAERFRCGGCGGAVSIHDRACSACGRPYRP